MRSSTLSPVYDVPMALDDNFSHTRGIHLDDANPRAKHNARQSWRYTLGPMPVEEFLEEFLPPVERGSKGQGMLSSRYAFRSVPSSASSSAEVGQKLMEALNQATKRKSRCPGFNFVRKIPRPTIPHHPVYVDCVSLENEPETSLGFTEFFFDVHLDDTADYFADPPLDAEGEASPHSFISPSEDDTKIRRRDRAWGQHMERMTEILARQHRVFAFSAAVFGSSVRLLRWDRTGCVVSAAFDIHQQPNLLCEFLWRFSQTTGGGRGHDLTVEVASPGEEQLFYEAIREYVRLQLDIDGEALDHAMKEHYQPGHVVAVHMKASEEHQGDLRVLISRPVISPLSATGKGTRGYWAVVVGTLRVVFLKDSWRPAGQTETEGAIVSKLNELGVRNVPELVEASDVIEPRGTQCTLTDVYATRSWVCPIDGRNATVSRRVHCRMLLGTVGYGLSRFKGTSELLHATYDVFQAMQDAYRLDFRLHRDISLGNMILVRHADSPIRRGCLIDWELSSKIDENGVAVDRTRAGTWLYMSVNVLERDQVRHTIQDDMESLLYVVLYASLNWLPHDLDARTLASVIFKLFSRTDRSDSQGYHVGGDAKYMNAVTRAFTNLVTFTNGPLHSWINTVLDLHQPFPMRTSWKTAPREPSHPWSSPARLEEFWAQFLVDHVLPDNDRIQNDIAHPLSGIYSDTKSPPPPPRPRKAAIKRNSQHDDPEEIRRPVKRFKPIERALDPVLPFPPSPRRLRARGPDGRVAPKRAGPRPRGGV